MAVLGNSNEPGNKKALRELEPAARQLGIRPYYFEVRDRESITVAFESASKERVDAAVVLSSPVSTAYRVQIAEAAVTHRVPAIYQVAESAESGGLVTYGISTPDL